MTDVLVVGYGSIGKRHAGNLAGMGIRPYVLTRYPEGHDAHFIASLSELPHEIEYAIIASPTVRHLADFEAVCKHGCRRVLVEKPIEMNLDRAESIRRLATQHGATVHCAYNLRFMKVFQRIKEVVRDKRSEIRLVRIVAGQYLPEWRPYKDYRLSYSARRDQGGGVDLDISHEVDYMTWIFGAPEAVDLTLKRKISRLAIDGPDYFLGIYRYPHFLVQVELDYIRQKERTLRILGENQEILNVDMIGQRIAACSIPENGETAFDIEESYRKELAEFLGKADSSHLATLDEAMESLKLLGL